MTPDPALHAVISQARHLLFAFDGTIRLADAGKLADSNSATVPNIHDVLTACRESGRSASVISTDPPADVLAYLDRHDLLTQITVVAPSIVAAANAIKASPPECLLITNSTIDIKAAQTAGIPAVAYARTSSGAAHLVDAGATTSVYSMANLTLIMRDRTSG